MDKVQAFENDYMRKKIPDFKSGDTVRIHVRVVEGERERIQVFQGTVIKRQGKGLRETFTVRKISFGVGTERTFPVHSPMVAKIEIKSRGTVRRAKLYYLRDRIGKKARVKEAFVEGGIPASADIEHSDAERKRLGLDEKESREPEAVSLEEEPNETEVAPHADKPAEERPAAEADEPPVVAEEAASDEIASSGEIAASPEEQAPRNDEPRNDEPRNDEPRNDEPRNDVPGDDVKAQPEEQSAEAQKEEAQKPGKPEDKSAE